MVEVTVFPWKAAVSKCYSSRELLLVPIRDVYRKYLLTWEPHVVGRVFLSSSSFPLYFEKRLDHLDCPLLVLEALAEMAASLFSTPNDVLWLHQLSRENSSTGLLNYIVLGKVNQCTGSINIGHWQVKCFLIPIFFLLHNVLHNDVPLLFSALAVRRQSSEAVQKQKELPPVEVALYKAFALPVLNSTYGELEQESGPLWYLTDSLKSWLNIKSAMHTNRLGLIVHCNAYASFVS